MDDSFSRPRIDVLGFAKASGRHAGELSASSQASTLKAEFPRLWEDGCDSGGLVSLAWRADGEFRQGLGGIAQPWLHLSATAVLPMLCQRCLRPVETKVTAERSFRFVADESTAAKEDDDSEEDVMVLEHAFDLLALVEDELLMALPLVPMHDECPVAVVTSVSDVDFDQSESEKPHPFAGLGVLKRHQS